MLEQRINVGVLFVIRITGVVFRIENVLLNHTKNMHLIILCSHWLRKQNYISAKVN